MAKRQSSMNEGPLVKVHRPHLTPAQAALEAKYRPRTCQHCVEAGRTSVGSAYVFDPLGSTEAVLPFYCLECGFYVTVPRQPESP